MCRIAGRLQRVIGALTGDAAIRLNLRVSYHAENSRLVSHAGTETIERLRALRGMIPSIPRLLRTDAVALCTLSLFAGIGTLSAQYFGTGSHSVVAPKETAPVEA